MLEAEREGGREGGTDGEPAGSSSSHRRPGRGTSLRQTSAVPDTWRQSEQRGHPEAARAAELKRASMAGRGGGERIGIYTSVQQKQVSIGNGYHVDLPHFLAVISLLN